MIDYGLMALIVVVLALVGLTFHAWRGVKAEIVALLAIKAEALACIARVTAVESRQTETEKAPAALNKRVDEVLQQVATMEVKHGLTTKSLAAAEKNILSLNGRIARSKHKRNRIEDDGEQDPAPQGEGEEGDPRDAMPPGSFPVPFHEQPQVAPIPTRFGVVARKVSNG